MFKITNIDSFISGIKAEVEKTRQQAISEMLRASRLLLNELMSKTPVWSGETVRNYVAGIGAASGGTKAAAGTVDPGPTNSMSLGEEPRRAENEAAARADLETALAGFNNLALKIAFTNTVAPDKWDLIDNGKAPEPGRVRYASVISVLAEQSARTRLEHFK